MRINDFEQMQQNLEQMKSNLENIKRIEPMEPVKKKRLKKGRRAVEKKKNKIKCASIARIAKEEQIIVLTTIVIVAITCIFSTTIFAKTMAENVIEKQEVVAENEVEAQVTQNSQDLQEDNSEPAEENIEKQALPINAQGQLMLETNQNAIELEEILMENVSVLKSKEYAEEERPIEFETQYVENPNLPEGEEKITQNGVNGRQQVTVIKSYENNEMVSENILEAIPIENATPQIVDKGTSKFLANNKVHLGDTMYVTEEVTLQSSAEDSAEEIVTILESLDVTLEELKEETWCKVTYDGLEGFVKSKYLTSAKVTPGIVDANRRQKIKMTLNEDIALNQSTDLTLEDYQKILSGNKSDKNHVLEENAEAFYNVDKNYHINGIFVASMAIHESGWGTSTIAQDKKNLFGYGAYDSSPYQSSFSFETYAEGIDLVARVLVKNYINEAGTPIYDDEVAKGSYYNGPTVSAVNIRYASDQNWHNKVYSYMEYLYHRL